MSFTTYILFSPNINRYYIGYTSYPIQDRLKKHLSNHKGYTGKAKDWIIVFTKLHIAKSDALALEKKIKKRGAKRFLKNLEI